MFTESTAAPYFLGLCSVVTAARTSIIFDLIFGVITLLGKVFLTGELVHSNVFQIVASGIFVAVSLLGVLCIFRGYRTTMLIFLMLDGLALILNILAWIIIVVNVSKKSLYEALCNSPGDCPKIFNVSYVVGLIVAVVGALLLLLSLIFLKCYIELLQYLEKDAREQEQREELRKRAGLHVTTDVQTSLTGTPRSIRSARGARLTANRPTSFSINPE